ncbi:MAG: hypothetical protein LPK80_00850 [Bacteroidota bacterium]|nr:hypothetical protein [Bacteroidota bacterium]MDX5428821.1 hypothetical protein [Bacteroidota bacterium]MDX5449097.1 hypothetical protein [Bacteroidota bacterium]MDX5506511.1 hypothetical protein [Bacteroidota bacterium]
MFSFLSILALLLMIAAIIFIVLPASGEQQLSDGTIIKKRGLPPRFKEFGQWRNVMILLIVSVVFYLMNASVFYARPGHQYFIVSPFGEKSAVFESGYKLILPFSRVQEWEKFIDVKAVEVNQEGKFVDRVEGIEGVIPGGINVRFIDQVTGVLKISARFQLPQDGPSFIALAEEFRHPLNLVNNTLLPTVKEQAYNVAYMYTAESYVSGSASDFRQTLDDALKNGGFKVIRKEYQDTVYEALTFGKETVSNKRVIKDIKTRYEIRKVVRDGLPVRIPHDITKNKIIVSQVIVDDLQLESKFRKKLEEQRDISAQKRIELQKIETAQAAQQRIIAEGERDKAAERVAQERAQVSKLIEIETKVKEEESKRQLAEIALKTERLEADRRKVAADAKRYELQQADGLSEEEKYRIDAEVRKTEALARAVENAQYPSVFIEGGGGKSGTGLLESLIGAEIAKEMIKKQ